MTTPLKILLVLSALLYMSEAVAQTYYYDVTKTLAASLPQGVVPAYDGLVVHSQF